MAYKFNPFTGKLDEASAGTGGGATELNDLTDVSISSATHNDVLKYDSVAGVWKDDTIKSSYSLDDLSDVSIVSAAHGDVLKYDSVAGVWKDDTIPGATTAAGSDKQIQFNDGGTAFGGDADLTWDKTTNVLTNKGDIALDDGGSYTTTLQVVTPTANRTISLPNLTGTIGLIAGSSGQLIQNSSGAYAGVSTMTFDGTNVTLAGRLINSYNGTASSPAKVFTGTWFTGGTGTTTKPHFLVEPTGATSTAWSASGTGIGVNAASGFAGNLLDLQVNGTAAFTVGASAKVRIGTVTVAGGNRLFFWNYDNTGIVFGNNAGNTPIFGCLDNGDFFLGSTADVRIVRDGAANILAQRNGTNAQTFRVYNTYTSGTNYERGKLEWSSNVFRIGTEKGSGGGTARALDIQTDGTTRLTVGASGGLTLADAQDLAVGSTTGTKIGTATTQKLGFYNATPVVQPTAVGDITTTATTGTLPTANGSVTIADAAAPTNAELLEYCVELEAKLEAALSRLRDLGLIAT